MGRRFGRVELLLILPSVDDFITIHDDQVAKAPDRTQSGIFPDGKGKIEFMIDQINQYPIEETTRPIVNAVTVMYEHIIRNHPFIDCNKRTAIMSCFETCLMNKWYFKKINAKTEVAFAKKVAKTTIDELGYEVICRYFEDRIIPYKKFIANEMVGKRLRCPFCGSTHPIYPGLCQCGKQLTNLNVTYHGLLRDYHETYRISSLQLLVNKRNTIRRRISKRHR